MYVYSMYICVHTYMYMYIYITLHTCILIEMQIILCASLQLMYIHVLYIHVHTYIYTCIYIHIYMYMEHNHMIAPYKLVLLEYCTLKSTVYVRTYTSIQQEFNFSAKTALLHCASSSACSVHNFISNSDCAQKVPVAVHKKSASWEAPVC